MNYPYLTQAWGKKNILKQLKQSYQYRKYEVSSSQDLKNGFDIPSKPSPN
jgi:hypothetical protein